MNDSKRSILEMLEQGKISQEQASQLLEALGDGDEPETEAEEAVENMEPVVTVNDADGTVKIYSDSTIELEGENGESAVLKFDKDEQPITLTLHPEDGNVVVNVPSVDENGEARTVDAAADAPAPVMPIPPVAPVPPVPPVMPAMPAMPAAPAMPSPPAIPAPPASNDPEELERYQEEVESLHEQYQEEVEAAQGRYQELMDAYQEQVDAQNDKYLEELERYQEQLEQYQEQAARRAQEKKAAKAGRDIHIDYPGANPNSSYWPLTDAEYNEVYNEAYNRVYHDAYNVLYNKFGPGTEGFNEEVQRIAQESCQAALEAVEKAREEKRQNGPFPGGAPKSSSWSAWANNLGQEINRAMNGIGEEIGIDLSEAMEDVRSIVGDLKESLQDLVDDWREQKEEEEEDEDDEDGFLDFGDDFPFGDSEEDCTPVEQPEGVMDEGGYVNSCAVGLTAVEKLDIDWLTGQVEIAPWDGDFVQVEERAQSYLNPDQRMRLYVKDARQLSIRFWPEDKNRRGVFGKGWGIQGFAGKQLTVRIPRALCGNVEKLKVNAVSAKLVARELAGEKFELSTVSGRLRLSSLHAENISAHAVSGKLEVSGLSAEKLKLSTVSGKLLAEGCSAESAELNSVSGSMDAHCNAERFQVHSTSGRAQLRVDQCPEKAKLSSVSGALQVALPENNGFVVDYNSMSGSFSSDFPVNIISDGKKKKKGQAVYGNGGGTRIEMHTTSGSMRVQRNG